MPTVPKSMGRHEREGQLCLLLRAETLRERGKYLLMQLLGLSSDLLSLRERRVHIGKCCGVALSGRMQGLEIGLELLVDGLSAFGEAVEGGLDLLGSCAVQPQCLG